jgi:hypothetical protein
MKTKYLVVPLAFLLIVHCGEPTAPREYVHTQAGFKITVPQGWRKTAEDKDMYEFRSGDRKLIEVGSFPMDVTTEEFGLLSDEDFFDMLKESAVGGLDAYCNEAHITGYRMTDQRETVWAGIGGFRMQVRGTSTQAMVPVVVDLVIIIFEAKSRMFMFISQIEESVYPSIKSDLESMITSFQLIE